MGEEKNQSVCDCTDCCSFVDQAINNILANWMGRIYIYYCLTESMDTSGLGRGMVDMELGK